jgi:ribose 5-phosphate isomerase A
VQGQEAKRQAAEAALGWVENGMVIGLGSGTTATIFVELLGERTRQGLQIRGVPTSSATSELALKVGIQIVDFQEVERCDLAVDGADEVDRRGSAIKGGGAALLREKIVATATRGLRICVADESKLVEQLGAFPLPVEVIPFARPLIERRIRAMGATPSWRRRDGEAVVTDNGNHLLDCAFGPRDGWQEITGKLDAMPGVVCHGVFPEVFDVILIGRSDGAEVLRTSREPAADST